MDPSKLPIAFKFVDYNTFQSIQDDEILSFWIVLGKSDRVLNPKTNSYQLHYTENAYKAEKCDPNIHLKLEGFEEYIKKNDFTKFFCFPLAQTDFKFGGSFVLGQSWTIEINLLGCKENQILPDKSLYTNKCKSQEIIDQVLRRGFFHIMVPQLNIDASNPNNIFSYFSNPQITILSSKYTKSGLVNYKIVDTIVDDGILVQNLNTKTLINFQEYKEISMELDENIYFNFQLGLSTAKDIVRVNYKKIQTVIAEIGGFINITLLILSILISKFIETDFYCTVMNDTMNFFSASLSNNE